MPFTISHAVLAPPLSKLSGGRLPIAALAIGCMTPDLYRLFTPASIMLAHQWSGLLFPNLPIGLLFCVLWYLLYRPVIYDFLGLQHDLKIKSFDDAMAFIFMSCLAIILGAATHLIWDGLTHLDFRSFAFQDFLGKNVALLGRDYPVHFILQIGCSVLALPLVYWQCLSYYRRHKHTVPVAINTQRFAYASLLVASLAGALSVLDYQRYITAEVWQRESYFFIGKAINEFTQTALTIFTAACVLWRCLSRTA